MPENRLVACIAELSRYLCPHNGPSYDLLVSFPGRHGSRHDAAPDRVHSKRTRSPKVEIAALLACRFLEQPKFWETARQEWPEDRNAYRDESGKDLCCCPHNKAGRGICSDLQFSARSQTTWGRCSCSRVLTDIVFVVQIIDLDVSYHSTDGGSAIQSAPSLPKRLGSKYRLTKRPNSYFR